MTWTTDDEIKACEFDLEITRLNLARGLEISYRRQRNKLELLEKEFEDKIKGLKEYQEAKAKEAKENGEN